MCERPARQVGAAIAHLLLPDLAPDSPASWLRASQVRSFRRTLAAVRTFGGVLLADPVGTGKTFVGLAVANALHPKAMLDAFVPAILRSTWMETAQWLDVPIRVTSHERVSRGQVPEGNGPVLIDESHRFRSPTTRRYRELAPRLVGRPTILLSGTPVVNRLDDLANQLLLAVPDDVLRHAGIGSLRKLLGSNIIPPSLGAILVQDLTPGELPSRREGVAHDWLVGCGPGLRAMQLIDELAMSRDPGVASLLRTGLLRALASSPAALRSTVRRYLLLVEHARAARRTGKRVSRADVQREVGSVLEQLVLWEVLPDPGAPADLVMADIRRLRRLQRLLASSALQADPKVDLLRAMLRDCRPTIVFSTYRDTVEYLVQRLGHDNVAWLTGSRAGIGRVRYPRRLVLDAFAPARRDGAPWTAEPTVLVATDVAAEGLNLQHASRVVHYDLPWTAVRLEQRDGRAARMGSLHTEVEIVRFDLPDVIEARLAICRRLAAKARLPGAIGLGRSVTDVWQCHRALLTTWGDAVPSAGWAVVVNDRPGVLVAGVVEGLEREPVPIVLVDDGAGWIDDLAAIATRLDTLADAPVRRDCTGERSRQFERARRELTDRAAAAAGSRLAAGKASPRRQAVRIVTSRLLRAVTHRNPSEAREADSVLTALGQGMTAGMERLVAGLVDGDRAAWDALARIGIDHDGPRGPARVRVVGLIVFVGSGPGG